VENKMLIGDTYRCCILVFAKFPKAGMVKTRLAEAIGAEKAAELYSCMVLDTIDYVKQSNFPFEILYWPSEFGQQIKSVFGSEHSYAPQAGDNLSQRLINGFNDAFGKGFEYVLAIGSDSPDMPDETIAQAFIKLKSKDAVIGPTADGGYYLIGFSKKTFDNKILQNISWSTPEVLTQTLKNLANQNKTVSLLNLWYDIDTVENIQWFTLRYRWNLCRATRTLSYILKEFPLFASTIGVKTHVRV
jgi:rSAM/selenodomain-associated transferase 1